jgi:hypothetical protein
MNTFDLEVIGEDYDHVLMRLRRRLSTQRHPSQLSDEKPRSAISSSVQREREEPVVLVKIKMRT